LRDLAQLHKDRNEYQEAVTLYSEIWEIHRASTEKHLEARAVIFTDLDEFRSVYNKAVELHPESQKIQEEERIAGAVYEIAQRHRLQEEYDKAIPLHAPASEIRTALDDQKSRPNSLKALAAVRRHQDKHDKAIRHRHIVIIAGQPENMASRYDVVLLLRHVDYRHENNAINFTLLNDFDVDFTDSTGVRRVIPRADTTRDSIKHTIQGIMSTAERNDQIVFFFSGLGEYAEVDMVGNPSKTPSDCQCVIAGDGRRIYVEELLAWFCHSRYPSVAVTAVFDICYSGGSL
ncbi:hypothetical protein FRC01_014224, partial [Tulasnella sp. 417]